MQHDASSAVVQLELILQQNQYCETNTAKPILKSNGRSPTRAPFLMAWNPPARNDHSCQSLTTMSPCVNRCPTSLANSALQRVHFRPPKGSLRPTVSTGPVA